MTELKYPMTHEILEGFQSNEDVASVEYSNDKPKTQAYSGLKDMHQKKKKTGQKLLGCNRVFLQPKIKAPKQKSLSIFNSCLCQQVLQFLTVYQGQICE